MPSSCDAGMLPAIGALFIAGILLFFSNAREMQETREIEGFLDQMLFSIAVPASGTASTVANLGHGHLLHANLSGGARVVVLEQADWAICSRLALRYPPGSGMSLSIDGHRLASLEPAEVAEGRPGQVDTTELDAACSRGEDHIIMWREHNSPLLPSPPRGHVAAARGGAYHGT